MRTKKKELPHSEHPTHGLVNGVDPVISFMQAMPWPDKKNEWSRDGSLAVSLAYHMSGYFHYCTGTQDCRTREPGVCAACREAARLAVQFLVPAIEKRVVEDIQSQFGVRCDFPHGGED